MKKVGLHIRTFSSVVELAEKAIRLGVRIIQCFFVKQYTSQVIRPTTQEVNAFLALREQYFDILLVHGSYWINLASLKHSGMRSFNRELDVAKRLGFTHMVLHPGTAKGAKTRKEGIEVLAKRLNEITDAEHEIIFVLENTAHAGMAVGSDLQDFYQLRQLLDKPERVAFCVDTAHAYAYGYDVVTPEGQASFVSLLDRTMGLEQITLIHLNDTKEPRGSHIDRHALLGDGNIGFTALKRLVTVPALERIPLLLELPNVPEEKEVVLLDVIRSWS